MALILQDENLFDVAERMFQICETKGKTFDRFFPVVPELFDNDDTEYGIFFDVKPSDLDLPVNSSVFRFGHETGSEAQRGGQIYNLKRITRKQLRKRCGLFAVNPFCLEVGFENFKKNMEVWLEYINGSFRILRVPNYETDMSLKDEILTTIQACLGCQFNLENQNYVYLKPDYAEIGFCLPLDNLSQVKSLFALRDVPEGKQRRAALRHWVAKHLRRKPSNYEEMVEVRKHLRGKTDFSWMGMSGSIYVNN